MGIENWSQSVILVHLPREPDMGEELDTVCEMVRESGDRDVVIDFADVDIVNSTSLAALLRLRQLLCDSARSLILCSVACATKGVFSATGLDAAFTFRRDAFEALATVQMTA
jgi:anti-anti-sigma factor